MGSFLQDLRYGIRTLIKDRAFLFTAVLALALGIGSTTAIFSVIDNVLLEPFPYTDGQRLMAILVHDNSSSDSFSARCGTFPSATTRRAARSPQESKAGWCEHLATSRLRRLSRPRAAVP